MHNKLREQTGKMEESMWYWLHRYIHQPDNTAEVAIDLTNMGLAHARPIIFDWWILGADNSIYTLQVHGLSELILGLHTVEYNSML